MGSGAGGGGRSSDFHFVRVYEMDVLRGTRKIYSGQTLNKCGAPSVDTEVRTKRLCFVECQFRIFLSEHFNNGYRL